jgi:hypothetical protein
MQPVSGCRSTEMTLSRTTKDHDEIRRWAESRGAIPAEVTSTERGGEPGILRFEFPKAPGHNDSKLKEISWGDFFEKFDENDLELLYQEKTAEGQKSNFNKLVHPSSEEHSSRSKSHPGSQGGRSNKSEDDGNESRSGGSRSSSKSHSSSSASHSGASGNTHTTRATNMKDEDLDDEDLDDAEEMADADDLDDNGEPRSSSTSSTKSNKSGNSSHSGTSHSSGSKSQSSSNKSGGSTKKK